MVSKKVKKTQALEALVRAELLPRCAPEHCINLVLSVISAQHMLASNVWPDGESRPLLAKALYSECQHLDRCRASLCSVSYCHCPLLTASVYLEAYTIFNIPPCMCCRNKSRRKYTLEQRFPRPSGRRR